MLCLLVGVIKDSDGLEIYVLIVRGTLNIPDHQIIYAGEEYHENEKLVFSSSIAFI